MKLSIALLALMLTGMLGYVAYYGRRSRLTRDLTVIARHHAGTTCALWLMLIAVVLIEALIHQTPHAPGTLRWVHLPLAASFAGLFLLMRFRCTGLRNQILHRWLAYACLSAYLGALITGGALLWHL